MVRFIALLAWYREYAECEVHHASAGGDRLIVMTTLDVANYDGASVLVGCDKDPEKHIFNTNVGNLRPAIQGMQKRGPEECFGNYSQQLVRGCGYWFLQYFGSITQRQA